MTYFYYNIHYYTDPCKIGSPVENPDICCCRTTQIHNILLKCDFFDNSKDIQLN
jgi:hypothetical protein